MSNFFAGKVDKTMLFVEFPKITIELMRELMAYNLKIKEIESNKEIAISEKDVNLAEIIAKKEAYIATVQEFRKQLKTFHTPWVEELDTRKEFIQNSQRQIAEAQSSIIHSNLSSEDKTLMMTLIKDCSNKISELFEASHKEMLTQQQNLYESTKTLPNFKLEK